MNSGLYAFAGDSATATAAACANRLDEPMTNVSNVYFGLSRAGSTRACRRGRSRGRRRPVHPRHRLLGDLVRPDRSAALSSPTGAAPAVAPAAARAAARP